MLGLGWLKDKWDAAQERKRLDLHKDQVASEIMDAIKAKDCGAIDTAYNSLETQDGFWRRDRLNNMLRTSIQTNDVAVFQKVMEISQREADYTFYEHSPLMPGAGIHFSYQYSLLYYAIQSKAEDVALHMVNDLGVSVYESGEYNKSKYHSGGLLSSGHTERTKDVYDQPLELAKEAGMDRLAAVLAEKMASDLQQQAAALRQKTSTLRP